MSNEHTAEVTREHREAAALAVSTGPRLESWVLEWVASGDGANGLVNSVFRDVAQAIAAAYSRGQKSVESSKDLVVLSRTEFDRSIARDLEVYNQVCAERDAAHSRGKAEAERGEGEAAWAVRVLDAWAGGGEVAAFRTDHSPENMLASDAWLCHSPSCSTSLWQRAATPDAARIAAARSLAAADPTLPQPEAQRDATEGAGWVAVEERLPDPDGPLTDEAWSIVYAPARGVDMASWDGERWIWRSHGYAIPSEVTHWTPLPAPPPAAAKGGRP